MPTLTERHPELVSGSANSRLVCIEEISNQVRNGG